MIHETVDPILTEKHISGWLGLSLPSLQRMRSNGSGPSFVQLSQRRIGYRRSDVEAWLAARTTDRIGGVDVQRVAPQQSASDLGEAAK
jgi:predicted DNA-binding transcriptional regulator AlpA